jgi:hypothetical protein
MESRAGSPVTVVWGCGLPRPEEQAFPLLDGVSGRE